MGIRSEYWGRQHVVRVAAEGGRRVDTVYHKLVRGPLADLLLFLRRRRRRWCFHAPPAGEPGDDGLVRVGPRGEKQEYGPNDGTALRHDRSAGPVTRLARGSCLSGFISLRRDSRNTSGAAVRRSCRRCAGFGAVRRGPPRTKAYSAREGGLS